MVRRYPPEHFPEKFRLVKEAYDMLSLNDDLVDEFALHVMQVSNADMLFGVFFGDMLSLPDKTDDLSSLDSGAPEPNFNETIFDLIINALSDAPVIYMKPPSLPKFKDAVPKRGR
jgi:hypothetical protein